MTKFLKFFYCVLFLMFFNHFTFAQKAVFINEGKLLNNTYGYKQAVVQMDTLKSQIQKELLLAKELLNAKTLNLLNLYSFEGEVSVEQLQAKLSENDKKKFELLQEENQLLENQAKAKEEEYQQIYKEKVGTILERVNIIVKEYCKKNKIDILYKIDVLQPAIAYYDESKDITNSLVELINKKM